MILEFSLLQREVYFRYEFNAGAATVRVDEPIAKKQRHSARCVTGAVGRARTIKRQTGQKLGSL